MKEQISDKFGNGLNEEQSLKVACQLEKTGNDNANGKPACYLKCFMSDRNEGGFPVLHAVNFLTARQFARIRRSNPGLPLPGSLLSTQRAVSEGSLNPGDIQLSRAQKKSAGARQRLFLDFLVELHNSTGFSELTAEQLYLRIYAEALVPVFCTNLPRLTKIRIAFKCVSVLSHFPMMGRKAMIWEVLNQIELASNQQRKHLYAMKCMACEVKESEAAKLIAA